MTLEWNGNAEEKKTWKNTKRCHSLCTAICQGKAVLLTFSCPPLSPMFCFPWPPRKDICVCLRLWMCPSPSLCACDVLSLSLN